MYIFESDICCVCKGLNVGLCGVDDGGKLYIGAYASGGVARNVSNGETSIAWRPVIGLRVADEAREPGLAVEGDMKAFAGICCCCCVRNGPPIAIG